MSEITELLASARAGDAQSGAAAFALLYEELRRLAHSHLKRHQTITLLDTTSLVHESYLKLVGGGSPRVEDKRHFFAYASKVMRSVVVDFARAALAERRGGGADRVAIDTGLHERLEDPAGADRDVLKVHEALEVLEQADAGLARIVEMRYFGGLTEAEIAQALDISERTVRRNWEKARLLLAATLQE